MKTVFKVGMKVYDQLMFPDKEGIVLTINYKPEKFFNEDVFDENYVHPYPIEVEFGSETMLYTSDGNSGFMDFPTLSTKPYQVEFHGFEQNTTIPTFEEVTVWLHSRKNAYIKQVPVMEEYYTSEEEYKAFEALKTLVILRDYYNNDWQPDWEDKDLLKFSIISSKGKIGKYEGYIVQKVMAFKDKEIRDKFLEEQRELLEIAKPLL